MGKLGCLSFLIIFTLEAFASIPSGRKLEYKTSFGSCPLRSTGQLTLELVEEFGRSGSLLALKSKILNENLEKRHFLSSYQIQYDPVIRQLAFTFECPIPLMKVQFYKDRSFEEVDHSLLVDNGELYDPTYEILFFKGKHMERELPFLALPAGQKDKALLMKITQLLKFFQPSIRSKIAELIIGEGGKLTLILSSEGKSITSAFGEDLWEDKAAKLQKTMNYMLEKKKIPSAINLTNSKKVVVKFTDSF